MPRRFPAGDILQRVGEASEEGVSSRGVKREALELSRYRDRYRERLTGLIEAKIGGHAIIAASG